MASSNSIKIKHALVLYCTFHVEFFGVGAVVGFAFGVDFVDAVVCEFHFEFDQEASEFAFGYAA